MNRRFFVSAVLVVIAALGFSNSASAQGFRQPHRQRTPYIRHYGAPRIAVMVRPVPRYYPRRVAVRSYASHYRRYDNRNCRQGYDRGYNKGYNQNSFSRRDDYRNSQGTGDYRQDGGNYNDDIYENGYRKDNNNNNSGGDGSSYRGN